MKKLCLAASAAVMALSTATFARQPIAPCQIPSVTTDPASSCDTPVFASWGWHQTGTPSNLAVGPWPQWEPCLSSPINGNGFAHQTHLGWGLTPGDFAPRSSDYVIGSYPMTPADAGAASSMMKVDRPMAGGIVDLVTGQPMIQEEDFELPFGGAMFRHIRTSSVRHSQYESNFCFRRNFRSGEWWDWQGYSWMMSENPLFLIDEGATDLTGAIPNGPGGQPTRRCYFVPDAFHAIPFKFDNVSGLYEAPPRFRAALTYDTQHWQWVPNTGLSQNDQDAFEGGRWKDLSTNTLLSHGPERFVVYLDGGTLKYTFDAVYNDVYKASAGTASIPSAHVSPARAASTIGVSVIDRQASGFGVPYLGVLRMIEDRHGNRVELDYTTVRQFQGNAPLFAEGTPDERQGCFQNTNSRGEISRIRLTTAGTGGQRQTVWTLLYVYREFEDAGLWFQSTGAKQYGRLTKNHVVDSVFAYEGDLGQGVPWQDGFLISADSFHRNNNDGENLLRQHDELNPETSLSVPAGYTLPSTWKVRARYLYSEVCASLHEGPIDFYVSSLQSASSPVDFDPHLLKRTVTRRASTLSGTAETSDSRLYKYTDPSYKDRYIGSPGSYGGQLSYVYSDATITQILQGEAAAGNPGLHAVDLIAYEATATVRVIKSSSPTVITEERSLGELADLRLFRIPQTTVWSPAQNYGHFGFDPYASGLVEAIGNTVGIESTKLCTEDADTELLVINRDPVGGSSSAFSLYHFVAMPISVQLLEDGGTPATAVCHTFAQYNGTNSSVQHPLGRGTFHDPYFWHTSDHWNESGPEPAIADGGTPLWIGIVEEYQSVDEALSLWNSSAPKARAERHASTRKLTAMNPAGYVLRTREWAATSNGTFTTTAETGIGESIGYDSEHRVAWRQAASSLVEADRQNASLVEVYEYSGTTSEVSKTSIRWGLKEPGAGGNATYPVQEFVHGSARPDLVTKVIDYGDSGSQAATETEYVFFDTGVPPADLKIKRKTIAKPAIVRDDSGTLYRPTTREEYSETGSVIWSGQGLMKVTGPSDTHWTGIPAAGDYFWVNYSAYDSQGRVTVQAVDVNTANPGAALRQATAGPTATLPTPPAEFARIDPDNPTPLHECTKNEYGDFGLEKTHYPNGKSTVVTFQQDGDILTKRTFPQAQSTNAGPVYTANTPGRYEQYRGAQVVVTGMVVWFVNPNGNGVVDPSQASVTADVTPQYDPNGRIREMTLVDQRTGENLEKQVESDVYGEVSKTRSVEGLITRTERDYRGRSWRTFKGTQDGSRYWYGTPSDLGPDNMILAEKATYGDVSQPAGLDSSVQSCLKLLETRRYADDVAVKYDRWNVTGQNASGTFERLYYDWRSRPVRTVKGVTSGGVDTVLSSTHTYLDMLGRQVFVATYGAAAPASGNGNPAARMDDTTPTAAQILTASVGTDLISLTENRYDDANNLIEVRSYSVRTSGGAIDTSGTNYTSTRTYTDGLGHTLSTVSPGSGTTVHSYDPRGRELMSRVIVNGIEVSRSLSTYDDDGRVIATEQRERMHAASASTLNDEVTPRPYISTYSWSWYDDKGRLVASADLGAAQSQLVPPTAGPGARPEINLIADTLANPYDAAITAGTGQMRPKCPGRDNAATFSASLPAGSRVTRYEYNRDGKQFRVIDDATGAVTEQVFDGLGQVVCKIEYPEADLGAGTPDGNLPRRLTFQKYDKGRLVGMASVTPGTPARPIIRPASVGMASRWTGASKQVDLDPTGTTPQLANIQITLLTAGANVVDSEFATISVDPTQIGGMQMPYAEGQTPAVVTFAYGTEGKLAKRTDERGVSFQYGYDALDRLSGIEVIYPWEPTPVGALAPDRVGLIEYEYDAATLRLARILAKTKVDPASPNDPPSYVVADTKYAYDGRGNLTQDLQEIGATTSSGTPRVDYEWDFASASSGGANYDRLLKMTYPQRPGQVTGSRRRVDFTYGGAGTIEHFTNAMTKLSLSSTATGTASEIAAFKRTGTGRRVETVLGVYASVQRYFDPAHTDAGYTGAYNTNGTINTDRGLDQFGRPKTLDYRNNVSSAAVQYTATYQYSSSGERTAARVTQATLNGAAHDNDRSWAYRYDYLGRMTGSDRGVQASNGTIDTGAGTPRLCDWHMDPLGNWTGDPSDSIGKKVQLDLFGTSALESVTFDHTTDQQNRIGSETRVDGAGTSTSKTFVHDAAGNMVSDGVYWYQYDGWGRIVQVDAIGTLGGFGPSGRPTTGTSGGWRVHYTYDGLGRLIRRQSAMTPGDPNTLIRTERYYHDGVRRIQEIFIDELQSTGGGTGGTGGANNLGGENPQVPTATIYTNREYVWGPGDVHGLDEIVAQIDRYNVVWYTLQDAGGDVVSIVKLVSQSLGGSVGAQYSWSPAGELMSMEVNSALTNVPANRLGHRALFYDRFEATPTAPPLAADPTSLNERGFYHCRNRVYSPWTGRFLQRDPNASGVVVLGTGSRLGKELVGSVDDPSMLAQYGDGMSLYGYSRGQPGSAFGDPLGLFLDLLGPTSTLDCETDEMQRVLEAGNDARNVVREVAGGYARAMAELFDDVIDFNTSDDIFRGGEDGDDDEVDESSFHGGDSGYYDSQKQWRGTVAGAAGTDSVAKRIGGNPARRILQANVKRGIRGEQLARRLFGGSKPGVKDIAGTSRFYDNLSKAGKLQEVKVGRRDFVGRTKTQAILDVKFASKQNPVQWVFFTSRRTKMGGPTKTLKNYLKKNPHITIVYRTGVKTPSR